MAPLHWKKYIKIQQTVRIFRRRKKQHSLTRKAGGRLGGHLALNLGAQPRENAGSAATAAAPLRPALKAPAPVAAALLDAPAASVRIFVVAPPCSIHQELTLSTLQRHYCGIVLRFECKKI